MMPEVPVRFAIFGHAGRQDSSLREKSKDE